jgi:hypothetical protein
MIYKFLALIIFFSTFAVHPNIFVWLHHKWKGNIDCKKINQLNKPIHYNLNRVMPCRLLGRLVTNFIPGYTTFASTNRLLVFNLWLIAMHEYTNSTTSFFISGQQNISLRSWYIFVAPRWVFRLLVWPSSRIFFLSTCNSGTYKLGVLWSLFRRLWSPVLNLG